LVSFLCSFLDTLLCFILPVLSFSFSIFLSLSFSLPFPRSPVPLLDLI
jgi:hypothetical protein